jgi:glyoxylase-like metal-dependent hydrolase (beta-lactamase superfamily II)
LVSHYRLDIVEYDTTGHHLDETVFYIRFAEQLREFIGAEDDKFLMRLLGDIDHIAQELTNLGLDPKYVFDSILETGRTLNQTRGVGFYVDLQWLPLSEGELLCLQLPCGGNIYILSSGNERVLIDTGYGIYYPDLQRFLQTIGVETDAITRIFLTHADADHAGAAGYFQIKSCMHPETQKVLQKTNRAYGYKIEGSILAAVYTRLINIFSKFNPPVLTETFPLAPTAKQDMFDVTAEVIVGKQKLQVLNGLGGHINGQVYFFCEVEGLLFTAVAASTSFRLLLKETV